MGIALSINQNKQIRIFSSFEEENRAEHQHRANMTPKERCREFEILQQRRWGADWTTKPMVKIASYEKVNWLKP